MKRLILLLCSIFSGCGGQENLPLDGQDTPGFRSPSMVSTRMVLTERHFIHANSYIQMAIDGGNEELSKSLKIWLLGAVSGMVYDACKCTDPIELEKIFDKGYIGNVPKADRIQDWSAVFSNISDEDLVETIVNEEKLEQMRLTLQGYRQNGEFPIAELTRKFRGK